LQPSEPDKKHAKKPSTAKKPMQNAINILISLNIVEMQNNGLRL